MLMSPETEAVHYSDHLRRHANRSAGCRTAVARHVGSCSATILRCKLSSIKGRLAVSCFRSVSKASTGGPLHTLTSEFRWDLVLVCGIWPIAQLFMTSAVSVMVLQCTLRPQTCHLMVLHRAGTINGKLAVRPPLHG